MRDRARATTGTPTWAPYSPTVAPDGGPRPGVGRSGLAGLVGMSGSWLQADALLSRG
jgi:hypothetical protein